MEELIFKNKKLLVLAFAVVVLAYSLAVHGIGFPNSLEDIVVRYVNLFMPAKITFGMWGFVFLGVALTFLIPYSNLSKAFKERYHEEIETNLLPALILLFLSLVFWMYEYFILSLLAQLILFKLLEQVNYYIYEYSLMQENPWLLKYPVGLFLGWQLAMVFETLSIISISVGMMRNGIIPTLWAWGMMWLTASLASYYYVKLVNPAVLLPIVWLFIGIVIDRYQWKNTSMMLIAIVGVLLVLIVYFYLLKLNKNPEDIRRARDDVEMNK